MEWGNFEYGDGMREAAKKGDKLFKRGEKTARKDQ